MGEAPHSSNMRTGRWRLRLFWPILLLLAAFVIFLEFIANVGGSAEPAPASPLDATLQPTPTPTQGLPGVDVRSLPAAEVLAVLDGETIQVDVNGARFRVRYLGSDAPNPGQRCAQEASRLNRDLTEGKKVRLLQDHPDTPEEPLSRYVFLETGQSLDALLISEGVAKARRQQGTYREELMELERKASRDHVGCLWQ